MDLKLFGRHDRNNHWCRFSRVKCACPDAHNGYERLNDPVLEIHSLSVEDKDASNEKEEELCFFNDDSSNHTVLVERSLCVSDLCQLLALKNRVAKSVDWSIVEHWTNYGLERTLEDHEYVLSAYRDMQNYCPDAEVKFFFRKDFTKYEFFHNPQQFFKDDMIDVDSYQQVDGTHPISWSIVQTLMSPEGPCPLIYSNVWVRDKQREWSKAFLLLRDKKLYITHKLHVLTKYLKDLKSHLDPNVARDEYSGLTVLASLDDYHVYVTLNAKNHFRAPTQWGLCLRPSGVDSDDVDEVDLRCLACGSPEARTCWITAMRLAKYGKQIRENYRAFKNKQEINPKEYNSYTVPNESVRSRVAMDFTGSVGRIVDDPKEAKAIAVAEGYSWKRRWRPSTRTPPTYIQGLESGVHITQPWFHAGMTRDQATALVGKYGTVDGVFLVRDSRSTPGCFVLTYKCGSKVLHAQISPVLDAARDAHVFSLDSGVTKFYDLLQLVEFYQLNAGCLPTRLTHYVVQSSSPVRAQSQNALNGSAQPQPVPAVAATTY